MIHLPDTPLTNTAEGKRTVNAQNDTDFTKDAVSVNVYTNEYILLLRWSVKRAFSPRIVSFKH